MALAPCIPLMLPVRSHSTLLQHLSTNHDTNGMHNTVHRPRTVNNRRSMLHSPHIAQQGPLVAATVISSRDLSSVNWAKSIAVVFSTNAATYQCLHKFEYIQAVSTLLQFAASEVRGWTNVRRLELQQAMNLAPMRSTGSVISSPPLCSYSSFGGKGMQRMQRI